MKITLPVEFLLHYSHLVLKVTPEQIVCELEAINGVGSIYTIDRHVIVLSVKQVELELENTNGY